MKKVFTCFVLLFTLLMTSVSYAQTGFKLKATSYVGALSSDPATDWTQNWTNWDPKNTAYPAATDTTTLNGMVTGLPILGEKEILGSVTLDANVVYLLKGIIVVRNSGELTIPAGTIIRAQSDISSTPKNYSCIVVERGGKINILGTEKLPVVFTSNKGIGLRDRGDWGGILLAGKAYHNLLDGTTNNNIQMEGFNNVSFDPTLARFGGTDNNDNSGEISYLRIEFGGLAFETNKEINGLTLGAVGSATKLGYVQVSYSGDDSFEWFGGSVNGHHLIAYKGTDDDFDTDNGYSGLNQFGLGVRDSAYYDLTYGATSGGSTSEGFESDNEATGTAAVRPVTSAIFSNFTMVGPVPVGSTYSQMNTVTKAAFRRGARIRRNSSIRIVNSIFMGYRNFLLMDGDSCLRKTNFPAALNLVNPNTPVDVKEQIFFTNNLICNTASAFTSTTDTTANGLVEVARAANSKNKLEAANSWLRQTGSLANNINPVDFTAGTLLVNPVAASTTPDFKPVANSPALSGANFLDNPILVNLTTSTKEIENTLNRNFIYPNPISNGQLTFGHKVNSFGIFDIKGNLLLHGVDTDHVNLDHLISGIYIIKLDGIAQKLIVE